MLYNSFDLYTVNLMLLKQASLPVLSLLLLSQLNCGDPNPSISADERVATDNDATTDAPTVTETLSGVTGNLQGTWRSLDDSLHTVTFEGNLLTMGYVGTEPDEPENFVVGNTCPGAPEPEPADEGRYLSVPDAGRCYYVVELTDNFLELSYVGRGNTLRYAR